MRQYFLYKTYVRSPWKPICILKQYQVEVEVEVCASPPAELVAGPAPEDAAQEDATHVAALHQASAILFPFSTQDGDNQKKSYSNFTW